MGVEEGEGCLFEGGIISGRLWYMEHVKFSIHFKIEHPQCQ